LQKREKILSKDAKFEDTSVTKATVAAGLGYPADRKETSQEPTGWIDSANENQN
jgi:hypothetical protein